MQKCGNNMYLIIASLSMATANADEMSGLYIGVGASVGYDEYESKVTVGQAYPNGVKTVAASNLMIGQYGFGNEMEDMMPPLPQDPLSIKSADADKLVNDLWNADKTGTWNGDNIFVEDKLVVASSLQQLEIYSGTCKTGDLHTPKLDSKCKAVDDSDLEENKLIWYTDQGIQKQLNEPSEEVLYIYNNDNVTKLKDITEGFHTHIRIDNIESCAKLEELKGMTTTDQWIAIHQKTKPNINIEGNIYYPINLYMYPNFNSELSMMSMLMKPSMVNVLNQQATYLSNQSLRCSGRNSGLEIKMSYFHDLGSNIVAGLDLTGAVLSKNRHNISPSRFDVNNTATDLTLSGKNGILATAKYIDGEYRSTVVEGAMIEKGDVLQLSNLNTKIAQNPNTSIIVGTLNDEYIDTTNGNKEENFEKGIFNPKLALVVGGTYNGWFAGIRGGVSYNTGKVKTSDMTTCKNVSIASPLVGVQVMKKLSPTTNLYMTADWNVGETTKPVNVNGIKTFKQSSYNVSAGVQWRCNLIK